MEEEDEENNDAEDAEEDFEKLSTSKQKKKFLFEVFKIQKN